MSRRKLLLSLLSQSRLPKEYKAVEYIESTGTQYINTLSNIPGGYGNKISKVVGAFTSNISNGQSAYGIDGNLQFYRADNGTFSDGRNSTSFNLILNTIYSYEGNYNNGESFVNGTKLATRPLSNGGPVYLFASQFIGQVRYLSFFKLYSCQIYDNDILVRNFIPCYLKSTGEAGLYDIVSKQFFTNQGTGVFKYPRKNGVLEIKGSGTLTSAVVQNAIDSVSNLDEITKVVIPVDFTSYDSGTITAIQNAGFANLRYLETCYDAGNMELDLQGDIVAKINDIGKTLDEALVYARTYVYNNLNQDANLIIMPPLNTFTIAWQSWYSNTTPMVLFNSNANIQKAGGIGLVWRGNHNIVEIKLKGHIGTLVQVASSCLSLKRVEITETGTPITDPHESYQSNNGFYNCVNLESIILNNICTGAIDLSLSTKLTRQALIDLFNSLGTPATQQTLTIGATNLAKLTADDIAIATAKNWVVQ